MTEVLVFKRDDFSSFLMPAAVHTTETTLSQECLSLVLVDDLLVIEVSPFVVIVEYVTISKVQHIVIVEEYALG